MTALNDIRVQLDQASGAIESYRRVVAGGTPVDLTGLDQKIASMCSAIAALPPGERADLKSALLTLMSDMDALVASLKQQQDSVAQELKGVSSRERAVSAYGKGGAGPRHKGGQD